MPATQDMMQIAQSASGAHTYGYRRGPGGLTPDFLTLSYKGTISPEASSKYFLTL